MFRAIEVLRRMKLPPGKEFLVHKSVNLYTTVNDYSIGVTIVATDGNSNRNIGGETSVK